MYDHKSISWNAKLVHLDVKTEFVGPSSRSPGPAPSHHTPMIFTRNQPQIGGVFILNKCTTSSPWNYFPKFFEKSKEHTQSLTRVFLLMEEKTHRKIWNLGSEPKRTEVSTWI